MLTWRRRPWTSDELQFVTENWQRMDDEAMAAKLKRTTSSVSTVRQKLGYKRPSSSGSSWRYVAKP
jgi:hypothetical protein